MNGVVFGNGRSDESEEVGVSGGGSSIRLMVGRRRRCSTGRLRFGFGGDEASSCEGRPEGASGSSVSGGMVRDSDVSYAIHRRMSCRKMMKRSSIKSWVFDGRLAIPMKSNTSPLLLDASEGWYVTWLRTLPVLAQQIMKIQNLRLRCASKSRGRENWNWDVVRAMSCNSEGARRKDRAKSW